MGGGRVSGWVALPRNQQTRETLRSSIRQVSENKPLETCAQVFVADKRRSCDEVERAYDAPAVQHCKDVLRRELQLANTRRLL